MQPQHSSNRSGSPIPFLGLALVLLISLASPTSSCTEQEKSSLLQLLAGLSRDGGLKALWRSDTDCCTWEGITCSGPSRTVTDVSLASRGLEGYISPFLGNLTGLLRLNLSRNSLSGGLPSELVSSSSIIILDVSFNRLTGGLSELPASTPVRPLQVLNISSNLFSGRFPTTIWEVMKSLVVLNASTNSFTGQIPTTPCISAPSFAVLELSFNQLSGNIPPGFSNCSMVKLLSAGYNNLSGTLPDELFKVTSLEQLLLPSNRLEGALNGISKLTNLVTLDLGGNELSGNIPESIGELKKLEELHLEHNRMSGELPSTLSNCTNLITIDLKSNNFSGELTKVNFTSLPNLKNLDLLYNNFTGTIPESIYSCSRLSALRLSHNNFHGQLSEKIGNLKFLSFLSLVDNSLTNLTRTLQILNRTRSLTTLLIGFNFMHETMPEDDSINGFESLQVLSINDCSLSGKIPDWLSKLPNLGMLLLHNNQLTGPIPDWISNLNFLFYLDISNNSLTGEISNSLMDMPMLKSNKTAPKIFELPVYNKGPSMQYLMPSAFPKVLNLGINNFTGLIPEKIGELKALSSLNLSSNQLSGEIPELIGNLTNLQVLDLSGNHLTGAIPAALNNLHFLSKFNISNNDLEGPIPTVGQLSTFPNSSYDGNPKLCGPMLVNNCGSAETPLTTQNRRKKKGVFALAFSVFFGGVAILFLLARLLVLFRRKSFMKKKRSSSNDDMEDTSSDFNSEYSLVMVPQGKGEENKLKLTDLLKATKNFDKDHIIGSGGYGLVYKAELSDGSKVAIKKLNSEMCLMEREFSAEGHSRLLIYSYMENGSLDDWLHNRDYDASSFLDWPMRLKIAQGASQGISYIHNVCKPHIVHRDIKSSNILLDKEFKAYVADFGLSRLIFPNNTHVSTELVGTLGYIPPEYGQGWVATLRGDMYSFGVVLLELLTGRRPVQMCPKSKELVQWVQEMRSKGKQIEVLDPALRGTGYEEQMLEVLEAACRCVDRNPGMRPTIQEVVSFLNGIDANLQKQNLVSTQCN
ncbi:tyrosine-sulfated glycopeptide receptor 1-like isoform X1 [Lolium rigidum]|uniref:tyrosine-sulfated glycopeptide receptor 1-like isoform X1 n=1 Tax=Lolium rigidum TaxID=89674 RepID=UPI001F5D1E6B|nr:tyrosine-sulfated glycopeptide receptor 1-like isoform X1 [Lolium rigidum]